MVGNEARIRVSSSMTSFLIGTLKSTRMNTRLPWMSRSRMESLGIGRFQAPGSRLPAPAEARSPKPEADLNPPLYEQAKQVHTAARVSPLVVVPGQHFHEIAVHDLRIGGIDDRRMRVALEVDGDELGGRVFENALERSISGLFQRRVEISGGRFLLDEGCEVDDVNVRRRHTHRES